MTVFDKYLPKNLVRASDLLADLLVLVLGVIMLVYGIEVCNGPLAKFAKYESIPTLSKLWMYLPVPIAGAGMIVFELENIYQTIRSFFAEPAEKAEGKEVPGVMTPDTASIAILLGSFLLLIVLRVPIAYAVGLSTVFCLLNMGMNLTTLATQLVKGIWSYSLMAVPFFITMGCLMGTGGISDKLVALANSLVGWMRGGLAMVNVVDSYFFGGISGSAAADTASLGSILIPMMVEQGYDDDFATALTITSSVEGILVPPSHNMVIYATSAGGVSVGALFMAGYIPGAILALCLMVGALHHLRAARLS